MSKTVSVVVTSFNRFEFLKQTIDSFLNLNIYPINQFIIIEDSCNFEMKNKILNYYNDKVQLIFNETNLTQPRSIDLAYSKVISDYIFHSEDDYIYNGNKNFIQDSIDILEERKDIHQIWIRHKLDMDLQFSVNAVDNFILDDKILETLTKVQYKNINYHFDWCGFSWNPGLRRTIDWKTMFPNGFQ